MSTKTASKNEIATVAENKGMLQPTVKAGTKAMAVYAPAEIETYDVDAPEAGEPKTDTNRQIPIVRVLQSNSPQVGDPRDGGIPGAKAGNLFNVVTREIFDGRDVGLYMVPVRKNHMVIEYLKRDDDGSGGGFVAAYEPENPVVQRAWAAHRSELGLDRDQPIFGKVPNGVDPESNRIKELVDTFYIDALFILPNEDGSFPGHYGMNFRGSFAFQSTFIPIYNSWDERRKNQKYPVMRNGKPIMVEPNIWTTIWFLRTTLKTKGNNKWFIPQLMLGARDSEGAELNYMESRLPKKFEDNSDNPLYNAAIDFYTELQEGSARLDYSADAATDATSGLNTTEDDIPFER